MAYTEAQARATKKYTASNIQFVKLALNKRTDTDIIEALAGQSNKQGYIKQLIREDIKRKENHNG